MTKTSAEWSSTITNLRIERDELAGLIEVRELDRPRLALASKTTKGAALTKARKDLDALNADIGKAQSDLESLDAAIREAEQQRLVAAQAEEETAISKRNTLVERLAQRRIEALGEVQKLFARAAAHLEICDELALEIRQTSQARVNYFVGKPLDEALFKTRFGRELRGHFFKWMDREAGVPDSTLAESQAMPTLAEAERTAHHEFIESSKSQSAA